MIHSGIQHSGHVGRTKRHTLFQLFNRNDCGIGIRPDKFIVVQLDRVDVDGKDFYSIFRIEISQQLF